MKHLFMHFILSILLFILLLFAQVWMRSWIILFNILPLFILVWSFRYGVIPGGLLVLLASWIASLCTPELLGVTPCIAIFIWMIARSQSVWLERRPYLWSIPVGFALTFIYLFLEWAAFSWMQEQWIFDEQLFASMLNASALEALIAPLWILLLNPLSGRSPRRPQTPTHMARKTSARSSNLKRGAYAEA